MRNIIIITTAITHVFESLLNIIYEEIILLHFYKSQTTLIQFHWKYSNISIKWMHFRESLQFIGNTFVYRYYHNGDFNASPRSMQELHAHRAMIPKW